MAASAERVQRFDFSKQEPLDSIFIEIHSLIVSFSLMRRTVRQRTEALLTTQSRLQQLVDDGIALAAQKDDRRLAHHTFEASRDLALADAVDTKSPHTGRHCARVPELAPMLAAVADATATGPLASFRLEGEAAWREYEVAAWLHDCGKITTPDHVVNKATKLETVCNRIHEIRTRFEVLWRDLEIKFWRELAGDRSPDAKKEALLADRQRQLADEFTFVADCNIGGERTNEADRERLMAIASRTWIRRLDDSLGLSEEERSRRVNGLPPDNVERLLADKAEHLVPSAPMVARAWTGTFSIFTCPITVSITVSCTISWWSAEP